MIHPFIVTKSLWYDHMGNFFDLIRKGDELLCNVDLVCDTMVGIIMAVDSLRYDKVLQWDANTEKVVLSNESSSQIMPVYRFQILYAEIIQ
ncbi:MAG: hypothetical protein H8E91_00805 [Planctomycetes bacterium]|nr:hypothetical protein [Planctomycetota bacterium]